MRLCDLIDACLSKAKKTKVTRLIMKYRNTRCQLNTDTRERKVSKNKNIVAKMSLSINIKSILL
ncbi:hypothetical protein TW85_19765 [Marinomonas sp. S3726]|nr:hypothetical protein TW85_19765 [Marinomonas sp. S3726]